MGNYFQFLLNFTNLGVNESLLKRKCVRLEPHTACVALEMLINQKEIDVS